MRIEDLDFPALQSRFNAVMEQVRETERTEGVAAGDREFHRFLAEEPTLDLAISNSPATWFTLMIGYELDRHQKLLGGLAQEL